MRSSRISRVKLIMAGVGVLLLLGVPIGISAFTGFPPPDDGIGQPTPSGAKTTIAQGTDFGLSWALSAYDSNQGLCIDFEFSGVSRGGGGSCGFAVQGASGTQSSNLIGYASDIDAAADATFVYGPVAKGVAAVDVVRGAEIQTADIFPSSSALGVDFFLVALPGQGRADAIVALGGQGKALQTLRIPEAAEAAI